MAARSCRRSSALLAITLLALLLLGASAAPPKAPPSAEEEARAARTLIDRADYDAAQKRINAALRRFASSDAEAVWALRVMRGELLARTGDRDGAAKILTRQLPPKLRTSVPEVRRLLFLPYVTGDRSSVEKARAIAAKHHPELMADYYIVVNALNLDPAHAEEHLRDATRIARRYGNRAAEARAQAAMVLALHHRRPAEAIRWGEQALPLLRELRLRREIEQTEGNLGWAYLDNGDDESAEPLFVKAEAGARAVNNVGDRATWLVQLGNLAYHRRDWAVAEQRYREVVSAPGVQEIERAYALANLARIALETRRLDDARRYNAEALVLKTKNGQEEAEHSSRVIDAGIETAAAHYDVAEKILRGVIADAKSRPLQLEAQAGLGRVYARSGRTALAEQAYRRAVETGRALRSSIDDVELRLNFPGKTKAVLDEYVDLLVASGRANDALAATELSRAESLEEVLGSAAAARALDPVAIAKQHNAVILCYWLGTEHSYLWSVTPAGVALATLPRASDIESAVGAYQRDLLGARGTLTMSGPRARKLYDMLVAPAKVPRNARVIVVGDGKLHALNFETLVPPSQPAHYWIEDAVVTAAGSLQLLSRGERRSATAPRSALIVGDPLPADPAFPPLAHAKEEIARVAQRFAKPQLLTGANATPAAYRAATPEQYDVLHFVAHGVATRLRPLDSSVILGFDAAKSYKLVARDIVAQHLAARLVTLSSCHGAGTRAYAGEGLVGLAWAFLGAGASNVIAGLWEVSDAATPQLMSRLYENLAKSGDPARALRDAKLTLVRSKSIYNRPLYWAPFVLYSGS
ncbi:MAG TPA: CHAT domain-containing protein [Thermoanaerobaculia bacterium]|jgi:CHAT domain-containing protein